MNIQSRCRIREVDPPAPQAERWQHGTLWRGVRKLVVELDDAHWYGMGALLHQEWPLEKLSFPRTRFLTRDNGINGLLGILEPFWASSKGAGIWVEEEEMTVGLNAPLDKPPAFTGNEYKKLPNLERPPLARTRAADGALSIEGDNLTVRFFEKDNVREVVEAFWDKLPNLPAAPSWIFEKVMWTTWAHFKNDISHPAIIEVVETAKSLGFSPAIFGIDAKWQREFGETKFDSKKFPEPGKLVDRLHELGCEVTLWTVPFFMPGTENFKEALASNFALRRTDGSPYLGKWWEGESAFLDCTNPAAMKWYGAKLQELVQQYGVDGFKFDAGEAEFYQAPGLAFYAPQHPNGVSRHYLKPLSELFPWSDARAAWRCQDLPMLFRQWDKKTTWGFDNGLASCITGALTLNLLGYRLSFPDMVGGNEWAGDRADAELLIRWCQAVAPMPVIQFSVPAWREGGECAQICARYARLHQVFAPRYVKLAKEKAPMLRPLWWLAPHDAQALRCNDEYLVGDDLLVAPVIEPGMRVRSVYLPPGLWRNYWRHSEQYSGSQWLRDFPAALDTLPLFERVSA